MASRAFSRRSGWSGIQVSHTNEATTPDSMRLDDRPRQSRSPMEGERDTSAFWAAAATWLEDPRGQELDLNERRSSFQSSKQSAWSGIGIVSCGEIGDTLLVTIIIKLRLVTT
jgi:hypothetical protein